MQTQTERHHVAHHASARACFVPLAVAAVLVLEAVPFASAQTTSSVSAATPAKANGGLRQSYNAWRATKLDGATVFNDKGTNIGTIDDMLLDPVGKVSNVVLSVGGFLGVGSKYVEVPFSQLKFEPSQKNANNYDYSIMLPGATTESLKTMASLRH